MNDLLPPSGSGSTRLGAAVAIPGTIPNQVLTKGLLKTGNGGDLRFGHPGVVFKLHTEPTLDRDPNRISFRTLNFPRTARIICDGTIHIRERHRGDCVSWKEADKYTALAFFMLGDNISVQRYCIIFAHIGTTCAEIRIVAH
jgi:2-methylaconitate isomerase